MLLLLSHESQLDDPCCYICTLIAATIMDKLLAREEHYIYCCHAANLEPIVYPFNNTPI